MSLFIDEHECVCVCLSVCELMCVDVWNTSVFVCIFSSVYVWCRCTGVFVCPFDCVRVHDFIRLCRYVGVWHVHV